MLNECDEALSPAMAKKSFELDPLIPSQFFETLRRQAPSSQGEYQLLIAVREDAVDRKDVPKTPTSAWAIPGGWNMRGQFRGQKFNA